jgi:hypothetical protein
MSFAGPALILFTFTCTCSQSRPHFQKQKPHWYHFSPSPGCWKDSVSNAKLLRFRPMLRVLPLLPQPQPLPLPPPSSQAAKQPTTRASGTTRMRKVLAGICTQARCGFLHESRGFVKMVVNACMVAVAVPVPVPVRVCCH